jgi:hypothetical protein
MRVSASKRWLMILVGGFCLCVTGATVRAGYKATYTVYHSNYNNSCSGVLGDARSSGNSTEYIGCSRSGGNTWGDVYCYCMTAAGNFYSCSSSSVNQMDAVLSLTPSSRIWFLPAADGTCTQISISNDSSLSPVVP